MGGKIEYKATELMDDEKELLLKIAPNARESKHYELVMDVASDVEVGVVRFEAIDNGTEGPKVMIGWSSVIAEETCHSAIRENFILQDGRILETSCYYVSLWESGLEIESGENAGRLQKNEDLPLTESVASLGRILGVLAIQLGFEKLQRSVFERIRDADPRSINPDSRPR